MKIIYFNLFHIELIINNKYKLIFLYIIILILIIILFLKNILLILFFSFTI